MRSRRPLFAAHAMNTARSIDPTDPWPNVKGDPCEVVHGDPLTNHRRPARMARHASASRRAGASGKAQAEAAPPPAPHQRTTKGLKVSERRTRLGQSRFHEAPSAAQRGAMLGATKVEPVWEANPCPTCACKPNCPPPHGTVQVQFQVQGRSSKHGPSHSSAPDLSLELFRQPDCVLLRSDRIRSSACCESLRELSRHVLGKRRKA